MGKDFSKFTGYKGKVARVEAPGGAENTAFNHASVRESSQRLGPTVKAQTDYSIPGKKRNSYKQDGD